MPNSYSQNIDLQSAGPMDRHKKDISHPTHCILLGFRAEARVRSEYVLDYISIKAGNSGFHKNADRMRIGGLS